MLAACATALRSRGPGITIGNVDAIEHSDDPQGAILVRARIKSHQSIPRNATLALSSSGIFGDSFLAFESHGSLAATCPPTAPPQWPPRLASCPRPLTRPKASCTTSPACSIRP